MSSNMCCDQENLSTSTSVFQQSANLSPSNVQSSMCLPKLQLPNFDGCTLKWPKFWDMYIVIFTQTRYSKCNEA